MQSKDFIYYEDKNNKICSLGIEFDNIITNNNKGLFRKNLGVPMSLFLLNNEKNALMNIINNIHYTEPNSNTKKNIKNGGKSINMKKNRKNIMETSCIGNELFEKLIELKKNAPKKQKKSRKKKKKRNKRTRKLFFF
tara:strand:- start:409 stop:819 length:411 start_codon:yes stop_codon:yes gene_type:complete